MRQNGWSFNLAAAHFALQIVFLLICIISINANPFQPSETSADNPKQMTELLSQLSSDASSNSASKTRESAEEPGQHSKPNTSDDSITIPGPFSYLNEYQWRKLTTPNRQLITEVAFNFGQRPSPSYAWISSDSYNKYLKYLEQLCRAREEEDIAEVNLDTLDSDYFRWEEIQFNRALIKQIFPETAQGDHHRYLNATQTLRKMHLRAEAPSECQAETVEDTWSDRANERSQFEDFIINTVLNYGKTMKMKASNYRKSGKKFGLKGNSTARDEVVESNGTFTLNNTFDLLDQILLLDEHHQPTL